MTTWPYPKIFAHRGGGTLAPENTLAAIRFGQAKGFQAVEFDVMLSKDSVAILMHDPVFGRTVRGHGSVADHDAADIQAMDAGGWHSPKYQGEPVPRFDAIARYCAEHHLAMNPEIKPTRGHEVATGRAAARICAASLALHSAGVKPTIQPLLSSFSVEALEAARAEAPQVPRGLLVGTVNDDWKATLRSLDCISLHCPHDVVDKALVEEAHAEGYAVFCYTVNDPSVAQQLFTLGIDALCTDRLDMIGPDFGAPA